MPVGSSTQHFHVPRCHIYKVMKTKVSGEFQKDQGMRRQLKFKRLEVIQMGENNPRFMEW